MKHQYTYTFFNVNKTVFEFFSVSHITEEMVKFYTIQQFLFAISTVISKHHRKVRSYQYKQVTYYNNIVYYIETLQYKQI